MSEPEHLIYASEPFEATAQLLANELKKVSDWMQQFLYCEVFVRLPPTLEFEKDFSSARTLARVVARISVLKRHESLVDKQKTGQLFGLKR